MASDRTRAAGAAGFGGVILGILLAVVSQGGCAAPQPAAEPADAGASPAAAAAPAVERRVIRPERAPNTGLPFSPGILVGDTLYVAGHLGRDPVSSELVSGGIEAETRQALANIQDVLTAAGMELADVTSVTVYITDFADFPRFNEIYREYFPADPPARATVQVAALNAGAHVELQMIAVAR
jgi:2-iminobutanoate/2-iminopropanoate deaminase